MAMHRRRRILHAGEEQQGRQIPHGLGVRRRCRARSIRGGCGGAGAVRRRRRRHILHAGDKHRGGRIHSADRGGGFEAFQTE
jgi:hypothetical protein